MGFKLKVQGADTISFGIDVIRNVHVELSTPNDSRAKSSQADATMWISGKLLSIDDGSNNSDTLELFKWSKVPAQISDAYRNVTVEVVTEDKIFREINFPNAFVIDYSERYNDNAGIGEFSLVVRQKADKILDIKVDRGHENKG